MTYFPINQWKLYDISKSTRKNKKYMALIQKNNQIKSIHFGDKRYQHFKDNTPLKLYSHLDHNDPQRRENFRKRHKHFIKKGYYSAGYFSWKFLW